MKEDKGTINDLQNITHQTKVRVTRTTLKSGGELRCSGRVSSSCSICITRRITIKRDKHHMIWISSWTPVHVNKYKHINKIWTSYKWESRRIEHRIMKQSMHTPIIVSIVVLVMIWLQYCSLDVQATSNFTSTSLTLLILINIVFLTNINPTHLQI